ncbi:hypothetical protein C8R44DRAFT_888665 [Mycena epipterygia]|nr:hypothetical protein C8R44DRAFT_888665 [Mycena epipterygia]
MRDNPDDVVPVSGGWKFHLVTEGREVGVWKNWTVAQTMISGHPNAAHKGHHSYAACQAEWQQHCLLGVHPHPVDPKASSSGQIAGTPRRRRPSSTPPSRRTSGAARHGVALVPVTRYYAIWGAGIVYSTKYAAGVAFDEAVDEDAEPELLSSLDFETALAYAEGNV